MLLAQSLIGRNSKNAHLIGLEYSQSELSIWNPFLAIDNCNAFHEKATGIAAERKMNNLTRSRYTELLELLEISQLMDTTVRNGYYDEALELIEFARKLGKVTHPKFASIV